MKNLKHLALLVTFSLLIGCATNYQYRSLGELIYADTKRKAVLYWNVDDGHLWYGKKYRQVDNTITLRVCGLPPTVFSLDENNKLMLKGRANDISFQQVNHPVAINAGQGCGQVQLKDAPVSSNDLQEGTNPELLFWCKNETKLTRYPLIQQYIFQPITRTKNNHKKQAPNPCLPPHNND